MYMYTYTHAHTQIRSGTVGAHNTDYALCTIIMLTFVHYINADNSTGDFFLPAGKMSGRSRANSGSAGSMSDSDGQGHDGYVVCVSHFV